MSHRAVHAAELLKWVCHCDAFLIHLFVDNPALTAPLPAQSSCDWSQGCAEVGWGATLVCVPWDPVRHRHRLPKQQGTRWLRNVFKWLKILYITISKWSRNKWTMVRFPLLFSDHRTEDQRQPLCQRLPRERNEQQKVNTNTCSYSSSTCSRGPNKFFLPVDRERQGKSAKLQLWQKTRTPLLVKVRKSLFSWLKCFFLTFY